MSNCTTEYLSHRLITYSDPTNGNIISQDDYTERKITIKLSNKRGMTMFKKNDYLTMQEATVRSLLDLKLWNYLVKNFKQSGVCMTNGKPITITSLTEVFGITRQKVSGFIRRAIEADFIRKQGTSLTINPLVLIPYGIADKPLYELQEAWTTGDKA
jgi:hypothetical protein